MVGVAFNLLGGLIFELFELKTDLFVEAEPFLLGPEPDMVEMGKAEVVDIDAVVLVVVTWGSSPLDELENV